MHKYLKIVVKILGILLLLLSVVLFRAAFRLDDPSGDFLFIGSLLGLVSAGAGTYLYRKAKYIGLKRGEEVLETDQRAPILYLRSFIDDPTAGQAMNDSLLARFLTLGTPQNLNSEEEQMERAVAKFGPFVAIGDPKERIPQLGAARLYTENDKWQEVVTELIQLSRLVILRVGKTPGFWWEVETVMRNKNHQDLLFLLPDNTADYRAFKTRFEQEFHISLPETYKPLSIEGQSFGAVLMFDVLGEAQILYSKDRVKVFYYDHVYADFKEIIHHVLEKDTRKQQFGNVKEERSRPKRTFLAQVQHISAAAIVGLIATSILIGIAEEVFDITPIESFSPPMLVVWLVVSVILFLMSVFGERLNHREED